MFGARIARRTLLALGAASGVPVAVWRTLGDVMELSTDGVRTYPSNVLREMFGVCTHNDWQQTPYSHTTAMMDRTVALAGEVGASHFRERFEPGDAEQNRQVPLLVAGGAKMYATIGNYGSSVDQVRADVRKLATKYPDPTKVFRVIAGINEPDTGSSWVQHTVDLQKAIYTEVRSIPALNSIPVVSAVVHGTNPDNIKVMADAGMAAYCDLVGIHHYPASTGPFTSGTWAKKVALATAGFPGKPISVSEFGYANPNAYVTSSFSVPEAVAAVYAPRAVAEGVRLSLANTTWYELLDQFDRRTEYNAHYGLVEATFNDPSTWRRKPVFYTLARLVALTRDDGPAFDPIPLQATITGTPYTLALSKRGGTHGVLHWREDSVYDHRTKKPITVTPTTSTVTFPAPRAVTITNVTTGKVTDLGSVASYTVQVAGDALHASIN